MAVPLRQNLQIGAYLARQKLARREKFPLIVELEPRCANCMAHCGCEPTAVLATMSSLKQSLPALSGA